MKNSLIVLGIVALFLLSFDKATSLLTNRSKAQIIVQGNNANNVVNQVNDLYSKGYRVTNIVAQSVSSIIMSDNRTMPVGSNHHEEYGAIIVIMEK